jgi:4-diphosphocytidyl-2-C-methyl-D-erythritol kinase
MPYSCFFDQTFMSPIIHLTSSAKINLTLDVLGKDDRVGKHFLNTIFYRIDSLQDDLYLSRREDDENRVHCDYPGVAKGNLNTVIMALHALGERGWEVKIKKKIPTQAGLGGGSGNAGSIIKYFGEKKGIPMDHLEELARGIGADVPFFLLDENLAYAEGFGDQIVQSWQIPQLPIEIIPTGINVSTAEAYAGLDQENIGSGSSKTEALLQILNSKTEVSSEMLKPYIHNDFEFSIFEQFPQLKGMGNLCGSGGMLWNWRNDQSRSFTTIRAGN